MLIILRLKEREVNYNVKERFAGNEAIVYFFPSCSLFNYINYLKISGQQDYSKSINTQVLEERAHNNPNTLKIDAIITSFAQDEEKRLYSNLFPSQTIEHYLLAYRWMLFGKFLNQNIFRVQNPSYFKIFPRTMHFPTIYTPLIRFLKINSPKHRANPPKSPHLHPENDGRQSWFGIKIMNINNNNQMIDEATTLLTNPIKIIILGKVSVGKTSILLKYVSNNHKPNKETIGIDILTKVVTHMGKSYRMELWDTAGHERYRTVVYNYFYLANAALVIFDIADESSLDEARKWLTQIRLHSQDKIPVVLIGNKSDLFEGQELKKVIEGMKGKIEDITGQFSCQFFVVSALKGQNISLGFIYLLEKLIQRGFARGETRYSTRTIKLGSQIYLRAEKKKRSCC